MENRKRGAIEKRGENRYRVKVFVGEAAGKRQYVSRTVHGSQRDAQKALTSLLSEQDKGLVVAPSRMTLNEHLDEWLSKAARPRLRGKTGDQYAQILSRHIRPVIGSKSLAKLVPDDVQGVYARMIAAELSPRSVRYAHAVLHSALKAAVKWRRLSLNPAEDAELPRSEHSEMLVFSPEQVRTFLSRAEGSREYAFYFLAVRTGMRPSEIYALQWSDLDGSTIRVQRTLSRRGKSWAFEDVKRRSSKRTIDLDADTVAVIAAHRKRQAAERLAAGKAWQDMGLVFPCEAVLWGKRSDEPGAVRHTGGLPERERTIVDRFKALLTVPCTECPENRAACSTCQGAGRVRDLPDLRVYDLRHTAATLMLACGVSIKVVQERLGHANASMTLDVYSHVLPGMQAEAAERVAALLRGS